MNRLEQLINERLFAVFVPHTSCELPEQSPFNVDTIDNFPSYFKSQAELEKQCMMVNEWLEESGVEVYPMAEFIQQAVDGDIELADGNFVWVEVGALC